MFFHVLLRRFRITAAEYRGMAWHDQRMYAELLAEEIQGEADARGESHTRVDAAGDLSGSPFHVTRVPAG